MVGLSVMIVKDGKILLGKRKSSHGTGEFAFPGGHIEYMESFEGCIFREVQEETALEIKNIRFLHIANVKEYFPKHYVHLSFVADWAGGEWKVLEPEKCESWGWYEFDNLPSPLFATVQMTVQSYKTGKNFYDA